MTGTRICVSVPSSWQALDQLFQVLGRGKDAAADFPHWPKQSTPLVRGVERRPVRTSCSQSSGRRKGDRRAKGSIYVNSCATVHPPSVSSKGKMTYVPRPSPSAAKPPKSDRRRGSRHPCQDFAASMPATRGAHCRPPGPPASLSLLPGVRAACCQRLEGERPETSRFLMAKGCFS